MQLSFKLKITTEKLLDLMVFFVTHSKEVFHNQLKKNNKFHVFTIQFPA